MKKVLVTGATSTIGSYVLRSLIAKGIRPLASARDITKIESILKENANIITLDYNDSKSIEAAVFETEKIFLLPPMHPSMSDMMKNIISKLKRIRRIVSISASGADAGSEFPLLRLHGEIKDSIIHSGIPYTFLAPSHFYQNYIYFCSESICKEDKFYFPQGNSKKSMIDTFDIGEIAAKVLTEEGHSGKTYSLAGYDYDNNELAAMFTNTLKRKIDYIDIDQEKYKAVLKEKNTSDWKIDILIKLNAAWKAGSRLKSNEETKLLLGREPRTFLEFLFDNKAKFSN